MWQTDRSNRTATSCIEWQFVTLWLIAVSCTTAQYASSPFSSQYYGYNLQQLQQQQLQQQPQAQSNGYPNIPLTYSQQYPAAAQSIWSSAPIVVTDEANSLELQRQQQVQQHQQQLAQQQQEQQEQQTRSYSPINYYNNRETDRLNNYNAPTTTTTRAVNHNYNNVPGYFYYTQQQQQRTQQELEQRELLAGADSRRQEEEIVRIGGTRSFAQSHNNNFDNNNFDNYNYHHDNNFFEPSQYSQRREFETKYAQHFDNYLRKYPRRLRPLYNTDIIFTDK